MYKLYFQLQWKHDSFKFILMSRSGRDIQLPHRGFLHYSWRENKEVEIAEEQIKKTGKKDKAVSKERVFISL